MSVQEEIAGFGTIKMNYLDTPMMVVAVVHVANKVQHVDQLVGVAGSPILVVEETALLIYIIILTVPVLIFV